MEKRIVEFTIKLLIIATITVLGVYAGYVYCRPIVEALLKDRIVTFEIQVWPVEKEKSERN